MNRLPGGLERYAIAKVAEAVYLLGGRGFSFQSGLDFNIVYDPVADTFGFKSPLLIGVQDHAAAVIDGKIYLFGGRISNTDFVDVVQIYDPVSNSWCFGQNLPFNWAFMSTVEVNGKVYLLGGITEEHGFPLDKVYEFSPYESGKVIINPDTMLAVHYIDSQFATIYLGDFTLNHTVYEIDPTSILVNGSIKPLSWHIVSSHPDFSGEVMKLVIPLDVFIEGYMPLWDVSVQTYTVIGSWLTDEEEKFILRGSVVMRGHISGDVDNDGQVNVTDLVCLIDFLFKEGAPPQVEETADIDRNGIISVTDVTMLVDFLFSS